MPDEHGKPRRFLVLHDTVPGGTGYLDRIGDADRMHSILSAARAQLATCPCRGEGRAACHRCLLSVLPPREIEDADRALAVRLLDGILASWDVEQIDSVAAIDISVVHLSELERRFLAAITQALGADPRNKVVTAIGPKGTELDIALGAPGSAGSTPSTAGPRWRVAPLVNVTAGGLTTQPDFLLTRQDAPDAKVAVYLDGREFHASPEHNRLADDATKRAALRASGLRVWSITWDDVTRFEASLGPTGKTDTYSLVPPVVAKPIEARPPGGDPARARLVWGNPIDFLLAYLAAPGAPVWSATALELALGTLRTAKVRPRHLEPDDLHNELLALVAADPLPEAGPGTVVWGATVVCEGGLPLVLHGTRADPPGTLGVLGMLADDPAVMGSPEHGRAWQAWLHWANVTQFLPLPSYGQPADLRTAQFWAGSSASQFRAAHLPLGTTASIAEELLGDWAEVIAGVRAGGGDEASVVEAVLRQVAAQGGEVPEVGHEVGEDGWPVEVAWPAHRLAIVVDVHPQRDAALRELGWNIWPAETAELAGLIMEELAAR
jgi:hypothetical protein